MRTKKVTRHYCDFCNRGMFKRAVMESHERSCCRNPNRHCYLCKSETLVTGLVRIWERDGFKALETAVDYCPACILSAILQGNEECEETPEWNYKEALQEWHEERNPGYTTAFVPCDL